MDTKSDTILEEDSLNNRLSLFIGGFISPMFNGYMTDFRVYKGEAVLPLSYRINTDSDKNYYGLL